MQRSALVRQVASALAALLFAMPLLFMVSGSLRATGLAPPQGFELAPTDPTLEAYQRLPQLLPLWTELRNSVTVVAIAVPLTVLIAALAGYGMRLLSPGRRRLAVIGSLLVMVVPVTAVWATRFEVFRLAGAVDTFVPLVSTALLATNPFYALIYLWSFGGVSDSQLEAARLEGAPERRVFWQIALPQAKPATLAVAVLAFTFHWGNFIDALLYLNSQSRFTLPLGLRFLQLLNPTDFPLLLAGAVIVTLPAVAVFLIAQRVLLSDNLLASIRRDTR